MSGRPNPAARNRPFWPSSGVRHDRLIWKAACANSTLTMKVPNQATISVTPTLDMSSIFGFVVASSARPPKPGSIRNAVMPTASIATNAMQFIVWLNAIARIPPNHRNTSSSTAVTMMDA